MSVSNCFDSELSVPTIITSVEKIYMGGKYSVSIYIQCLLQLEAGSKSNKTVDPWQHGCYSILIASILILVDRVD